MSAVLIVGGTTYAVEQRDSEHVPYELRGPRGGRTLLCRNVPRPDLLFAVGNGSLRGRWFTDKGGTALREVVR